MTYVVASHNRLQFFFFFCFHKRVLKGCSVFVRDDWRGGKGGIGGLESPAFRTIFSHLPYFYALLSPDSYPLLCCSRLHVNQEDQNPGLIQTVPKLNILVDFLAFGGY